MDLLNSQIQALDLLIYYILYILNVDLDIESRSRSRSRYRSIPRLTSLDIDLDLDLGQNLYLHLDLDLDLDLVQVRLETSTLHLNPTGLGKIGMNRTQVDLARNIHVGFRCSVEVSSLTQFQIQILIDLERIQIQIKDHIVNPHI